VPEYCHKPVMLEQVLEGLNLRPGQRCVDGTLGGAGHAEAILDRTSPTGWLYGCDRDGVAIEVASRRLSRFAGRFELRQGTFDELGAWVPSGTCDAVLLDLGVSSPQLDWPERGFSFQADGPLDMRMDQRQGPTASEVVNGWDVAELARIFWEFGGEEQSRRIARAIGESRAARPLRTTRELADLIERCHPRGGRKAHPATKVFQALRMVVNDELAVLGRGLKVGFDLLRPGGRLAVITFHSLEDRMVKEFGREKARDYDVPGPVDVPELRIPRRAEAVLVSRKAIKPEPGEVRDNPRSRSAQLRVLEKV
jgi:16S rRNA (cytosine1402-N4)-methyltransferase